MGKRETSRGFSSSLANTVTVTNTTSEVTLFSEPIPAGKMGTSKKLTLNLLMTLTTPAISLPTLTLKVKLGSATLTLASGLSLALSQTNSPLTARLTIRNKDAANVQIVYGNLTQVANNLPLLAANANAMYADWSVDTSVDQTLSVTAQFGGLSSTTSLVLRDADLDLS